MDRQLIRPKGSARRTSGFSLVEMLVVVAVLSVLAIGTSLAVGRLNARQDVDQQRFLARFDQMRDQAILGHRTLALELRPNGMIEVARQENTTGWHDVGRLVRWQAQVRFNRRTAAQGPDILFLRTGETTPFEIRFWHGDRAKTCRSDGWTGVQCDGS